MSAGNDFIRALVKTHPGRNRRKARLAALFTPQREDALAAAECEAREARAAADAAARRARV